MLPPRKRNDSTGLRMGYQSCLSYAFYGGHATSERNVDKTNFTAESVYNSEKKILNHSYCISLQKLIKH